MDKIDAVEVLQVLKPWGRRDMPEGSLRTRVNVARPVAHTKAEFAGLLRDMEAKGLIRTRRDTFGELQASITGEGENTLAEAGA